MKFCKTLEQEICFLKSSLPVFPYKYIKKMLRTSHDVKKDFINYINTDITALDRKWKHKTNYFLFKHRFYKSKNSQIYAQNLLRCAFLYKEALRKILKKYNKKYGVENGRIKNVSNFHFQESVYLVELKCISQSFIQEELVCCICLDMLWRPVTQECGHLVCYECHSEMKNIQELQCPICRKRKHWFKIYNFKSYMQDLNNKDRTEYDEREKKYILNAQDKQTKHNPLVFFYSL